MHKELFTELVKLASEKKAYGVGYYGGGPYGGYGMGRGGWGGGRGGMMYAGRGGYMGPHPAMLPGMVRGQHAAVSAMGADAPEQGVGAAREYQQYAGLGARTPTTFRQQITDQTSRQAERLHMDDRRRHEQASGALTQAIREQNALQAQLQKLEADAQASSRAYEGRGGWGRLSSAIGIGSGQTQFEEKEKHQAALDAARRQLAPQIAAQQRIIDQHKGTVERLESSMNQFGQRAATREEGAYGQTSGQDAARENQYRQMGPGRQQADVNRRNVAQGGGAAAVGQPAPPPVRVGPGAGAPGGPAPAQPGHAPIPHQVPPLPKGPGQLKPAPGMQHAGSALSCMPLTMDNLIQGAARTMFDRYVKIATAKIAVELETAKHLGKKWGTSATLAKPEARTVSKPPTLTTAAYLNKGKEDTARTMNDRMLKRGNVDLYGSGGGLSPSRAAALQGKAPKQPAGDSDVDLGAPGHPTVGLSPGPTKKKLQQPVVAPLPGEQTELNMLTQARARHDNRAAEQAAWAAQYAPVPTNLSGIQSARRAAEAHVAQQVAAARAARLGPGGR